MKKLFTLLLLLISIGLHAQTCGPGSKDSVCSYGPITIASGVTTSLPSNGGLVPGFQYIFSSGSGTVTLHGCIGPIATGCVTLDSYTGGTTVRTPDEFSVKAPSAPYQYFTITPTYGAGTFTVLEVNNNTSKVGGSKLDLTATSPIVVTPNPITGTGDISCPTCGIGSGNANYTGTQDVVAKGTAVAHTLGDSTIGDDGFHATKTPNGVDTGVNGNIFTITDSTGVVGKALCNSGGTGILCPANTTTGILGVVVYIAGGLDHYCWSRCNAIWDNQTVIGDSGYIGSIAGEFHDSGNQFDTSGVQNVYANSLNAGAGTAALTSVLTPDQVAGGSISSGGGIQNPVVVAGTGGVTVNLLAAQDATDPARWILPASGNCGLGFAKTTTTVGNKFVLEAIPGQVYTAVADGSITAGNILIGGTSTVGRVKDSGAQQATGVSAGTCFMAAALAGATVGQTLPVLYLGLKFGVSGTASYTGSLTATDLASWTGTGGQLTDSNTMQVKSGQTLTIASGGTLTCAGGSTCPGGGLTNVVMPADKFGSSITGSVETVTTANQVSGYLMAAPPPGTTLSPYSAQPTVACTVVNSLNTYSCVVPAAIAAGDSLYMTWASKENNGSGIVTVVTDNHLETFSNLHADSYSQDGDAYFDNTVGGATTITLTVSGTLASRRVVMQIWDITQTSGFDTNAASIGYCGTIYWYSVTPTVSGDLIIGSCVSGRDEGAETLTVGSGWLLGGPPFIQTSPYNIYAMSIYAIGGTAGVAVTPNMSVSYGLSGFQSFVVAFKPFTSGSLTGPWAARPLDFRYLWNTFPALNNYLPPLTSLYSGDTGIGLHQGAPINAEAVASAYTGTVLFAVPVGNDLALDVDISTDCHTATGTLIPSFTYTTAGSDTITITGSTTICGTAPTSIRQSIRAKSGTNVTFTTTSLTNSPSYNVSARVTLQGAQ